MFLYCIGSQIKIIIFDLKLTPLPFYGGGGGGADSLDPGTEFEIDRAQLFFLDKFKGS